MHNTKMKTKYIRPCLEVIKVEPALMDTISVPIDNDPEHGLDPGEAESKGNNHDQWGYDDYSVESHWGSIWDHEK